MSKKTFIDTSNPALQFISQDSVDSVEGRQPQTTEVSPADTSSETIPVSVSAPAPTSAPANVASDTPNEKFNSSEKAPEGYKLNPRYIETKTKRVQLVLQPSLYEEVKNAAKKTGLSFNEYVHRALHLALKNE